jgi:8-oxo-dGTP pyrophosphatase MutT (NUDIX family)
VRVERSAGAVVFRIAKNNQAVFLLLQKPSGKWDFPKGNIEKGEPTLRTVEREIAEETGIVKIEISPDFKETIKVFYRFEGEFVRKWIAFFLAKTSQVKVRISFEHQDFAWLPFKQAVKTASYPQSRRILHRARSYLKLRGYAV